MVFVVWVISSINGWAGEKEELQKDALLYQQQLTIMNQQIQLIQFQYPQVEAKLKEATEKLRALENKDKKPVAKEQIKK
jgi:hypothetical protein